MLDRFQRRPACHVPLSLRVQSKGACGQVLWQMPVVAIECRAPEVLHHSARIKSGRLACRTPPVCVPNAHNGYYIPAVSMAKLQCE